MSYSLTQARAWSSQASRPFAVPARHSHQARLAQLHLAFGPITLLPPRNEPRAGKTSLTIWVIRVWEEQAPAGEDPFQWILLTSVPTNTLEEAWQRVEWYAHRWLVEDYHQCLKSGCRIQPRQLHTVEGLMRMPDSYPHFTNKGGLSVHKRMRTAEALSLFTTRSEQRCACQAAPLFFLCKMWVRIRLRKQGSFSDVEKTTTDISFFQTSKRKGS